MSLNKPKQLSVALLAFFEITKEAFTDSWSKKQSDRPLGYSALVHTMWNNKYLLFHKKVNTISVPLL